MECELWEVKSELDLDFDGTNTIWINGDKFLLEWNGSEWEGWFEDNPGVIYVQDVDDGETIRDLLEQAETERQ